MQAYHGPRLKVCQYYGNQMVVDYTFVVTFLEKEVIEDYGTLEERCWKGEMAHHCKQEDFHKFLKNARSNKITEGHCNKLQSVLEKLTFKGLIGIIWYMMYFL